MSGSGSGRSNLTAAQRRRLTKAGVRTAFITLALGAAYFFAPMQRTLHADGIAQLTIWLIGIAVLVVWQTRNVLQSDYPAARAFEALGTSAPLLLLSYATTYFLMAQASATAFATTLTRMDALYFSVTVFATTGYGDITAHSEAARAIVTSQMLVNIVFLGIVVRFVIGAAKFSVRRGHEEG